MPLKKKSLRSSMQDANRAALDVPMPPEPGVDLHDPDPSTGEVFQYGAKKDPAEDLVRFDWPQHAPQGSEDATPTQVFSDGTNQASPIFQDAPAAPVRRRLTDAEARAQAIKHSRAPSPLRAKAQDAFANAKPVEQLAQEDAARILGRQPMAPPVTGELADAPIATTVDRRGANLGRAAGERRGAASGNMVSATPSNADIGDAVIKEYTDTPAGSSSRYINETRNLSDAGRESARTARASYQSTEPTLREQATGAMQRSSMRNQEAAMLGEMKPSEATPFDTGRMAADYTRENYKPRASSATSVTTPPPVENSVGTAMSATEESYTRGAVAAGRSLGEIAGAMRAGAYGTALMGTGSIAKNTLFGLASPLVKVARPALKAAKGIAERNAAAREAIATASDLPLTRRVAQAAMTRGGQAAGNTMEGLGGALGVAWEGTKLGAELATTEWSARELAKEVAARQNTGPAFREALAEQQRNGAKYGMDVSSVRSNSSDALLQFKALAGADPKINVTENPTLKAKFEAENRKRIRHLISTGSITPVAHGRPTISGSSDE